MALSADAFARRGHAQRPLPEMFLDSARRNWRRFAMADSSGRKVKLWAGSDWRAAVPPRR